jgi:hypothetical protein
MKVNGEGAPSVELLTIQTCLLVDDGEKVGLNWVVDPLFLLLPGQTWEGRPEKIAKHSGNDGAR